MLQFITTPDSPANIINQVASALEGGCKWIELRATELSDDEIRHIVKEIKPMCEQHEAFLVLTDRVQLAKELEVAGSHLTTNAMSPTEARIILGAGAVIGVSVNTFEEVLKVAQADIDYLAIGPFGETKDDDNRHFLDMDAIKEICHKMEDDEITIARVAEGDITANNIPEIMRSGVNGIAVSKAIADAPDLVQATRDFLDLVKEE